MSTDLPSATDILRHAAKRYAGHIVFATSFGVEDQVLTHMIASNGINIPLATLDTGRLFPQTYDLWAATESTYGIRITPYYPQAKEVEHMVRESGINLFCDSIEARHECCRVRKLNPLKRLLANKEAWVCGLRAEQAMTRHDLQTEEYDESNGLFKISPLANWTQQDVWDYVRCYQVPYNPLHDVGYPSIGCACCTRAVKCTEDIRAGRWWWEARENRECGLHRRPRH